MTTDLGGSIPADHGQGACGLLPSEPVPLEQEEGVGEQSEGPAPLSSQKFSSQVTSLKSLHLWAQLPPVNEGLGGWSLFRL